MKMMPFVPQENPLYLITGRPEDNLEKFVDFVVLSPVFATPSSPNGKALGWKNFGDIARTVDIPIYALGGMTPKDLPTAKANGAIGIAAIRSLWESSMKVLNG
jgi:thiamine monophosphate synthase